MAFSETAHPAPAAVDGEIGHRLHENRSTCGAASPRTEYSSPKCSSAGEREEDASAFKNSERTKLALNITEQLGRVGEPVGRVFSRARLVKLHSFLFWKTGVAVTPEQTPEEVLAWLRAKLMKQQRLNHSPLILVRWVFVTGKKAKNWVKGISRLKGQPFYFDFWAIRAVATFA